MKQTEYLQDLEKQLSRLPKTEIQEILADYREHFEMGLAAGKTEETIAASLGTPRSVAQGYRMSSLVKEADTSKSLWDQTALLTKMIFTFLVLAPFNFLVIVGPFMAIFGLTIGGWAIPVALGGVSIALFAMFFSAGLATSVGVFHVLSIIFSFFGMIGSAMLTAMLMILVTKYVVRLVVSYFRWNVNFITSRKS